MTACLGIRREDKDAQERRVPLAPQHVQLLVELGFRVILQPSPIRVHLDEEYSSVGAELSEDLEPCGLILGVKEIPVHLLRPNKIYMFFSHTIKGQPHNMPLLHRLMQLGCTLVDYEPIKNRRGKRLIGFGRFAGLAGMVDTLWALGRRAAAEHLDSPFNELRQACAYETLQEARTAIAAVSRRIADGGLPDALVPLVIGVVGYGKVARGAREILDLLPARHVEPEELPQLQAESHGNRTIYKTVFAQEHCFERLDGGGFDLAEYRESPQRYASVFARHAPYLSVLVNAIYWDSKYPTLLTRDDFRVLWSGTSPPRLRVIGDITCDVNGSLHSTVQATTTQKPTYIYLPEEHQALDACTGAGPLVLAVDNLPCEFSRAASMAFGRQLLPLVAQLLRAQGPAGLEMAPLAPELRNAVVLHRGALTPKYRYLEKHL